MGSEKPRLSAKPPPNRRPIQRGGDHQRHLHPEDAEISHPKQPVAARAHYGRGDCPHTAIREDASMNLEAVDMTVIDDEEKSYQAITVEDLDGVKRFFGEGSLALALYIMLDRQFPISQSA